MYVRVYNVPHGSMDQAATTGVFLPDAGDFLPGEESGACVEADGVTILPVTDKNNLVGLRVVVTAQYPVYDDISADGGGSFPLGVYFVKDKKGELGSGDSQFTRWRFEVPAGSWSALTVPDKGDVTPVALGSGGTVLSKDVDYFSVPGFVVCSLVCGWRWVTYDPLTRVSCRTVTVNKKQKVALKTGPDEPVALAGPVAADPLRQKYVVDGDDTIDETYVQITITSIVESIPDGWQGSNFNKRNDAEITIRGVTYATGKVLYTGGGSEDVAASNSPTGVAAYRLTLVLLAAGKAWPLTVDRYISTLKVATVVVENAAQADDDLARVRNWKRADTKTDSPTIRAEFDMAAALALLPWVN